MSPTSAAIEVDLGCIEFENDALPAENDILPAEPSNKASCVSFVSINSHILGPLISLYSLLQPLGSKLPLDCQLGICDHVGEWEGFCQVVDGCVARVRSIGAKQGAGWFWYWREDWEKVYTSLGCDRGSSSTVPADYVPAGHVLISADRYRIC
ncbi:hypothetical protein Tco_0033137 [Tanacetum coccineum]